MRKVLMIGLFLIIVLIVIDVNASNKNKKQLPLNVHLTETYRDDLPKLLNKRYIRVLTTVNRTNFFIHDGHLVGYEHSLLKGYEDFLNNKFKKSDLKVVLEFIPVARDELIPKLVNGYGDIAAAGLTITEERKKKVSFSKPYLSGISEVIVTYKKGFQFQNIYDLSGKKIYVRESSSYYQSLADLNQRLSKKNKQPVKIIKLSEELETEMILEMVNTGAINITVADNHIAEAWSEVFKDIRIHKDIALRTGSQIGWMVRKNNPKLLASINEFLKTHKKGTLLGNIYFKRYYKNTQKLKSPIEIEKWQRLKKYKEVIKRYAAKYNFDWHLILAMAFQESGLDHSQKSKAGAVGILQVLPSTARDKAVGINNVHKLENNVHAGVKYLAFLRDRYFTSEELRHRDQVRLALASYNAGPAKIRTVRNLAEEMGLNKNKWFRHVELAALRKIGQETVRYVSNINKYYVLYKNILKQKD